MTEKTGIIQDNFLEEERFVELRDHLLAFSFPWYFQPSVTDILHNDIDKENTEVVDLYKAAKKSTYATSDADMKKVIDEVEDPIEVLAG